MHALELLEAVKRFDHTAAAEFWPAYLRGEAQFQLGRYSESATNSEASSIIEANYRLTTVSARAAQPRSSAGIRRRPRRRTPGVPGIFQFLEGADPDFCRSKKHGESSLVCNITDRANRYPASRRQGKMDSTKRPIQELFPLMYNELRRVAGRYLGRERSNHTLQPTALANEAWLRLQNERGAEKLPGRTQGLALAAQAMRRVLVDHGRHQKSQKRGGRLPHVELDDLLHAARTGEVPVEDLITLESALTRLETIDPRGAEIVVLRFFSGLSVPEVADHLGISVSTDEGKWTHARAWLRRDLSGTTTMI